MIEKILFDKDLIEKVIGRKNINILFLNHNNLLYNKIVTMVKKPRESYIAYPWNTSLHTNCVY